MRIPVPIRATGYVRLHVPRKRPDGPAPAVVAIHGYGQPPEAMFAFARSVAPAGALVVAPEGPSAFYDERWRPEKLVGRRIGYGWIADPRRAEAEARNRDLIDRALEVAAERHPLDPARTFVVGFSQGVGVAADWWAHAPARAAGLAGLAGGVPAANRSALAALARRPVLWISGRTDPLYPPDYVAAVLVALREAGVALDAHDLDAGHDLLDVARPLVRGWLAARSRPTDPNEA